MRRHVPAHAAQPLSSRAAAAQVLGRLATRYAGLLVAAIEPTCVGARMLQAACDNMRGKYFSNVHTTAPKQLSGTYPEDGFWGLTELISIRHDHAS